jgi:hypothetical protein
VDTAILLLLVFRLIPQNINNLQSILIMKRKLLSFFIMSVLLATGCKDDDTNNLKMPLSYPKNITYTNSLSAGTWVTNGAGDLVFEKTSDIEKTTITDDYNVDFTTKRILSSINTLKYETVSEGSGNLGVDTYKVVTKNYNYNGDGTIREISVIETTNDLPPTEHIEYKLTYTYKADNTITETNDLNDEETVYSVSNNGQIYKAVKSTGETIDYSYQNNNLTSIETSNGNTVSYSYAWTEGSNNLKFNSPFYNVNFSNSPAQAVLVTRLTNINAVISETINGVTEGPNQQPSLYTNPEERFIRQKTFIGYGISNPSDGESDEQRSIQTNYSYNNSY